LYKLAKSGAMMYWPEKERCRKGSGLRLGVKLMPDLTDEKFDCENAHERTGEKADEVLTRV